MWLFVCQLRVGDRSPNCDWLTESKQIKKGVFAARTLLPNSGEFTAISIINVSGAEYVVPRGLLLGEAVPGSVVTGEPEDRRATDRSAGVRSRKSGAPPSEITGKPDNRIATDRSVGVRLTQPGTPPSEVTAEPDDRRATNRSAGVRLTQSGLVPGTMARSADWGYGCVGVQLDESRASPTNRAARCDSNSSDITLQRSVTAEDQGMVNSIVDFVLHGYSFDPVDASCSVLCSVRENFPGELDYLKPIIESFPDNLTEVRNEMQLTWSYVMLMFLANITFI